MSVLIHLHRLHPKVVNGSSMPKVVDGGIILIVSGGCILLLTRKKTKQWYYLIDFGLYEKCNALALEVCTNFTTIYYYIVETYMSVLCTWNCQRAETNELVTPLRRCRLYIHERTKIVQLGTKIFYCAFVFQYGSLT